MNSNTESFEMSYEYQCPICKNTSCEQDEMRATGSFTRFFDVQNKAFITISCTKCGHTQFFKQESKLGENILDFLFGR